MPYKFNIDEKLNDLLLKHRIFKFDREDILGLIEYKCDYCEEQKKCDIIKLKPQIGSLINELLRKLPADAVVAVRGAGKHTVKLFELIDSENKCKLKYLVDRNVLNTEFEGLPVFHIDEINDREIDFFVISSYEFRKEMKAELMNRGYAKKAIIDIYDYLAENKIFLETPFYHSEACAPKKSARNYFKVASAKNTYENVLHTENDTFIQVSLYKLILNYICIRDFMNTKKYINIYIANKYKDYSIFENFIADFDLLMAEIKERLCNKNNENIIVFLFDALENDSITHMRYMKNLKEKSIVFKNSFTQYNFTTSTLQTMFTGKDLIDDRAYETEEFTYDNSPVLNTLRDKGYKSYFMPIKLIGRPRFFENVNDLDSVKDAVMPEKLWGLLQLLLDNDNKGFYYLHFDEAHEPYYCGYTNYYYENYWLRLKSIPHDELASLLLKSLRYVDEQFEFYNEVIPDNNIKIMMSDHGYVTRKLDGILINNHQSSFDLLRTVLFVHSAKHELKIYEDVFSLNNFDKLISFLIGLCDDSVLSQDYSKLQFLPIYDKVRTDIYIMEGLKLPLPIRGIITKEEIYSIDYLGNESYYVFSCEALLKNIINEPEYAVRINELQKLCGTNKNFDEIFEHPKFKHAKKFYSEKFADVGDKIIENEKRG